jgi:hypothetical protein
MGHHLTGSEGKGPKKIEFGYDSQHLSFFYYWERIEIVFLEQRLQFTHGCLARHRRYGTRHIY